MLFRSVFLHLRLLQKSAWDYHSEPSQRHTGMGRIFEKRKHKMFKRFDKMSKAFTRIGKEIAIAVKLGGADPDNNPRLRAAIQNSKAANMPKDRVEAAIKRASSKDEANLEEIVYEGYGPFGVAIVIETATDNPTRTVANIRSYFNKHDGTLATAGSLEFLFNRRGVFKVPVGTHSIDDLEMELIDAGADDVEHDADAVGNVAGFDVAVGQDDRERRVGCG